MALLTVSELEEHELVPAFALVRTVAPGATLDRWLRHARKLRRGGGILALRGEAGELFGLLCFRVEACLRFGRVLLVDNFVAFELSGASPGRKALVEAAEAVARGRGCAALRMTVSPRRSREADAPVPSGWAMLGLDMDQLVLTKRLDRADGRRPTRNAAVEFRRKKVVDHYGAASRVTGRL